ncbi:MAG: hypothetical protein AB7S72_18980 [Draconibacterium sp.]
MNANITFSADNDLIKKAREKAHLEKTNLNTVFRKWLKQYAERGKDDKEIDMVMESVQYARAGKKFSREEMNER